MTSGSDAPIAAGDSAVREQREREREQRLMSVLDREAPFEALTALVYALQPQPDGVPLQETAIALDANVFLRLSNHQKSADVTDYLGSAHKAPLVLPGQVIQEFWNNQLQAVDSISSGLRKKFEQMKNDVSRVDTAFGEFAKQFEDLLDRFSGDYGYVYDEGTVRRTHALLDVIQKKALVPFAHRSLFSEIASQRKRTKTPPGFRDDGDGDFYVWVDLLTGLQGAKSAGQEFSKVALVSHDRKLDWVREGIAHPILISEVKALFGVPFEIWSIQRLADEVAAAT